MAGIGLFSHWFVAGEAQTSPTRHSVRQRRCGWRLYELGFPALNTLSDKGGLAVTETTHRTVEANGVRLHFSEAGTGQLVLGFPES